VAAGAFGDICYLRTTLKNRADQQEPQKQRPKKAARPVHQRRRQNIHRFLPKTTCHHVERAIFEPIYPASQANYRIKKRFRPFGFRPFLTWLSLELDLVVILT
jgi:hypothetical protein